MHCRLTATRQAVAATLHAFADRYNFFLSPSQSSYHNDMQCLQRGALHGPALDLGVNLPANIREHVETQDKISQVIQLVHLFPCL